MTNPIIIIDTTGGTVHTVDSLLAAAVPSGSFLVSALNTQLGSTVWQGGGSGTPAWGSIVGTLADQTDLAAALSGKAASSHTHTLSQISDITVTSDMVSIPKGIRPGLYDDHGTPPVGTIFESSNDGHLYWVHRDGSVHLLCDSGGYGGGVWGSITGTLSDQADLQSALNAKQPLDATLTAMAGVSTGAGSIILFTGVDTCAIQAFGAPAQALAACTDTTAARASLGLAIGSNVQAYDAELTAIAGLASAADTAPYFTGSGTAALMTVTSAARALLDDANAAAMRTTLGLGIGSNVQAYDAELTAIAGLASAADKAPYFTGSGTAALMTVTSTARTLLDDADAAAMRTTLAAASQTTADALQKQIQPAINNDRYYFPYAANSLTTRTMQADRLYLMPLIVPNAITATRIGINVSTGVAGSARLGIYADSNGNPSGAPLLDAGTVSTSTTGEKEITISLALNPGLYWIGLVTDAASILTAENLAAGQNVPNLGATSGSATSITFAQMVHTFGALPTISGHTWNNNKTPVRVWIRTP